MKKTQLINFLDNEIRELRIQRDSEAFTTEYTELDQKINKKTTDLIKLRGKLSQDQINWIALDNGYIS